MTRGSHELEKIIQKLWWEPASNIQDMYEVLKAAENWIKVCNLPSSTHLVHSGCDSNCEENCQECDPNEWRVEDPGGCFTGNSAEEALNLYFSEE